MMVSKKTMSGITALPMVALGIALAAGQCPQALAQPDIKRQGAGENQKPGFADPRPDAGRNPKLMGERKPGEARPDADQYRRIMEERGLQMRENFVRQSLMRQGVTDEKTLAAILECTRTQEKARQTVQEKGDKLRPALANNDTMADAQFNALLNEYQAAIEDYRDVREKAVKELDGKIGYSKKPRLQAALLMMNIIGDAPQADTAFPTIGKTFTMLGGQNFNGEFAGGKQPPGAAGQPAQVFGGQVQVLPDGVRVFDNVRVFEGAGAPGFAAPDVQVFAAPGFGAPQPNPVGPPPPGDKQANQRVEDLRREFAEQIKQLREEIMRIKAAQGNR